MDPVSITIGALTAGAAGVSALAAVGSLAQTLHKDSKEDRKFVAQTQVHSQAESQRRASNDRQQSHQAASSYNSYPVPQYENVNHYYRTGGTGRVTIGSDGRSISAGGSAPGDITFGYSTRTITYSSTTAGFRPGPNFNFNQSQTASAQFPFLLMPPPQQQQQGGFIQQSPYRGSRPASLY